MAARLTQTTPAPPAPQPPSTSAPTSLRMRQAMQMLRGAEHKIADAYQQLGAEVQRLTAELDSSNLELRRNLAEREKMQAILISTLRSLTIGVLAVGQDGVVIVANPAACEIFRRPLEQIATRHLEEILDGIPDSGQLLLTLQGAGGGQSRIAWSQSVDQGAPRQIELTAVRSLPPSDIHLAGLILAEDQTHLRRLEHQATLRSRLTGMGEIAMNLAHEIRNPLGSIALFATALERELEGNESLAPMARQIVAGVKSLEHLVANTLEFARPRRMAMARVNLKDVIRDTLVYLEHPLEQHAIQVQYDHELQPDAWVSADAEQLRQVFLNLGLNAIQAMDEGGKLEFLIQADAAGGWEVAVRDNGVGIPRELIERIFDPFFTTRDKGSGIGLAIVHSILQAHDARIEVESRVAVGTTFRVVFPAYRQFDGI
ncbi:MAG: Sporulation kinase A [candidate division BRC1 bacterium ADurb.BinA292]|nr:MAG: Sporulation kinase A [candidate division BRC1 bacterium ADurb.BinA292]